MVQPVIFEVATRRGPRRWARDKLEMRRYSRDARRRGHDRRLGKDFGPENLTEPGPAGGPEDFRAERHVEGGMDSRMAYDQSRSYGSFAKRFPGAARITRW